MYFLYTALTVEIESVSEGSLLLESEKVRTMHQTAVLTEIAGAISVQAAGISDWQHATNTMNLKTGDIVSSNN